MKGFIKMQKCGCRPDEELVPLMAGRDMPGDAAGWH